MSAVTHEKALAPTREDRQRKINALSIGGRMLSPEQVNLLKTQICRGASDDELAYFVTVCGRTGLDPFVKQIHWVMRYDSKLGRDVGAVQIGIDGFRLIAQRSGKYAGQDTPQWCAEDGVWRDVWFDEHPPAAARVAVYRTDVERPTVGIARWKSYVQTYKDKQTGARVPNSMWERMDAEQLAKCAEAQALRKAFPQDLANLYTTDELREIEGPRDLRYSNGLSAEAAKSSAAAIDEAIEEEDAPPTESPAPKPDPRRGVGVSKPAPEEPKASEPPDSLLDVETFLGTCGTATKALGRTLIKEAPKGSHNYWFVDQEIITETLVEGESPGSVHLSGPDGQMVPDDRLERLHMGLQSRLEALAKRTA